MDDKLTEFIEHMSVLSLKPDDIIVLKSPRRLAPEIHAHLCRMFKERLGISNTVMLLEDIDIGVLRSDGNPLT